MMASIDESATVAMTAERSDKKLSLIIKNAQLKKLEKFVENSDDDWHECAEDAGSDE